MGEWVDDVAKAMARGMSRRDVLRRVGGGLAGAALISLIPASRVAHADTQKGKTAGGARNASVGSTNNSSNNHDENHNHKNKDKPQNNKVEVNQVDSTNTNTGEQESAEAEATNTSTNND